MCTTKKIALMLATTFCMSFATLAEEKTNSYTIDENGVTFPFGTASRIKIGTDVEFGMVRDGALYASFGLELSLIHI